MPDWIMFFLIVVGLPITLGVASDFYRRWTKLKEKQLELAASQTAESAAQYAAKIERLEQRVAVLERIATDRGTHLADEIEQLRTAPLN